MSTLRANPDLIATPRSSAVSGAWRAIRADIEDRGEITWDVPGSDSDSQIYRLVVASDRRTRERAYRLAYRVYTQIGVIPENESGMCLSGFDLDSRTLTLLVEDACRREVATISLVFDSSKGLPADEVFAPELHSLRSKNRKVVEVTRLILDCSNVQSKHLLLRLFNFIYIFARRVCAFTDFVIEVRPRHAAYYRRMLGFGIIGSPRPCPRVNDTLSVLMHVDLVTAEREIGKLRQAASCPDGSRILYSFLYGAQDEACIAEFLARRHKPMSHEEAYAFKLVPAAEAPIAG